MKHVYLAIALALVAAGCKSSTVTTSPSNPGETVTFKAALLSSNENPPISNTEQGASGNVTITFVVTRDAANNIASVLGTAAVTMQGFPAAGSTVTLAHIHTGATGVNGPVLVNFVPPGGSVGLSGGEW